MAPTDPCLVRAERALATLGAQIEAALAVCLWADRFGASAALAIMADADSRAAMTLPEHPPRLRQPADVLESVVAVAVAAGLLVARANLAAATALVATTGSGDGDDATTTPPVSVVPSTLTSSWISSVLSDRGEADMGDWASRASAIFVRVRQAAAVHVARARTVVPPPLTVTDDTIAKTGPCNSWARRQKQQRQRQEDAPPVSTCFESASDALCLASVMRCAGADCRAPGRRITSGCVISAHCTADCRATFHRTCWENAGTTLADGTPCPTPDCWGEIARVTSARWRAADRPPRVLWQTLSSSPCASAETARVGRPHSLALDHCLAATHDHPSCADGGYTECANSHESGDRDHVHWGTRGADNDQDPNREDSAERERHGHANATSPLHGQGTVAAAAPTGGTPYHKNDLSREVPPGRRKRPRNRTGRRQRCRLARQQHDRLLGLTGLADPLAEGPKAEGAVCPRDARMEDDSLWPSFFVPDPA
ncbi:hypothetical protein TW95_gp0049 [Pandoravirus inopinatum]|uniref:Uncharacterized protein n=1 Tax=Pandoravirus inopinatum TaxID=1605721 RepID=A0A0B5IVU8_9VIRU|nr:hypothetical protein TW95_gp0049 [Pandoravirus inopinatum]AJF96783.1 hypothetical protein [Pandoravirus inopinatum]